MRLVEGLKRNAACREIGMLVTSCYVKMFFAKDVKLGRGGGWGEIDQRNCCPRVLLDDRSVEQAAAKHRGTVSVDDRAYTLRITQDRQE